MRNILVKTKNNKKYNNVKGITLLALVITIVVIIILATITTKYIIGDKGVINSAKYAKERTEISTEKELVDSAALAALNANEWEDITYDGLDEQLKINIGEGKYVLEGNGPFSVIYVETRRSYRVDEIGKVTEEGKVVEDKYPGDITKDEEGNKLDGSQEHPYEIWCIEDLVVFSNMTNGNGIKIEDGKAVEITGKNIFNGKYVSLKRNLDFKSTMSYSDSQRTDFGDINGNTEDGNTLINEMTTHMGFRPINNFAGTFDGETHSLNNIYINHIEHTGRTGDAALFVNGVTTTIIQNITVTGEIKANWHAAGICSGNNPNKIENCINYANITGYNMVGGICSDVDSSMVKNCLNYGELAITGKSYQYGGIGGIIGYTSNSEITNCINLGNINDTFVDKNSAGITGCTGKTVRINSCYNMSRLNASDVGGILGWVRGGDTTIINSYNYGNVNCGIVNVFAGAGWDAILSLNIKNCYNLGKASYSGILGEQSTICKEITLNIENCYNAGETPNAVIAEIVKDNRTTTVTNVSNTYYDETKSENVGTYEEGITQISIQNNQDLVNMLNENIKDDNTLRKWKLGEDGYPTFE